MALGSVLLSLVAAVFTLLGMFAVILPFAGSFLSFGAPALAVAGVVMGGVAMSRAKAEGDSSGLGLAGVIMNAMVFVPALLGAMTCGVCNAVLSGATVSGNGPQVRFDMQQGGGLGQDAGSPDPRLAPPPIGDAPAADAGTPSAVDVPPPVLQPGPR